MSPRSTPSLIVRSLVLCAVLAGCRGAGDDGVPRPAEVPPPPPTPTDDVVDDYHGVAVPDPYRWLEEQDSEAVSAWVDAQNARAEAFLAAVPGRQAIQSRLAELWTYPRWTAPEHHGPWWVWTEDAGLTGQPVLYRGREPGVDGEVLLDPNAQGADTPVELGPTAFSEDGSLLAYAVSSPGSDWLEWRVLEVGTGRQLEDHLRWSRLSRAAWTHDGKGFFYQRYPPPGDGDGGGTRTGNPQLCYHELGQPQSEDRVVYERPDRPTWSFDPRVTEDGRSLIITVGDGTERRNAVVWCDLEEEGWPVRPLLVEFDAHYEPLGAWDGEVLLVTDLDAPNRRVVALPLATPAPDVGEWRVIVSEAAEAIEQATVVADEIVVTRLRDASHVLQRYSFSGESQGAIELPDLATVGALTGHRHDRVTWFAVETFVRPPEIRGFDFDAGKGAVLLRPALHYEPDDYRVRKVGFQSADGTVLKMFVVHRKEIELDGDNAALLFGYGGFGVSLTPRFSVENLVFCERGGIFAQAVLRGGGEYGRAWHESGMRESKQNVFDDFIAAAEYLVRNDFTERERLAIRGRSNGGLLVGAVLTQRPELFGAAIPEVGVLDMLRYHRFTMGWAWEPEYGTAEDPEMFPFLRAYSPLHNVVPGTEYPATLILAAEDDDRVMPAHSYKFAATLQAAQAGDAPILLRVERSAGHAVERPALLQLAEATDRLAFLVATIGG